MALILEYWNGFDFDFAASTGVVAFAVIVPLFILIVILALYLKHKSHHAKIQPLRYFVVRVLPFGLPAAPVFEVVDNIQCDHELPSLSLK